MAYGLEVKRNLDFINREVINNLKKNIMEQSAVELIIEEINQQQKRYIDLAKKDKSLKKEVDAILTATTLLKMKCEKAKEMEKQQIIDAYEKGDNNGADRVYYHSDIDDKSAEQYYEEKFKK